MGNILIHTKRGACKSHLFSFSINRSFVWTRSVSLISQRVVNKMKNSKAIYVGLFFGSLNLPLAAADVKEMLDQDNGEWITIFDGKTLAGWHVSTKSKHSRVSNNTSGGKWEVVDGAITGSQDLPGNGGLIITDDNYGDFEVVLEMRNDFGPDSGLFLRSTEDGKAYQAMIDYHEGGNLMGIYGEGLGGKPHLCNYNFMSEAKEIDPKLTGEPTVILPVLPAAWKYFWRHGQWNELRARIVGGDKPSITTWINGVKFMEYKEDTPRLPATGGIALQIHGGGKSDDYLGKYVRYRSIRAKKL